MKSLPNKFFGPSGIPCVLSIDDAGNTAVGYFTKQIGSFRFLATDGHVTKLVTLAQHLSDVADLTHLTPGLCTILVQPFGGDIEHISRITEYRCTTLQGSLHPWHNADPTHHQAGIVVPSFGGETFFRLLEDGSKWLLETGDNWLIQDSPPYLLLENGGRLLLEDQGLIELEGTAS